MYSSMLFQSIRDPLLPVILFQSSYYFVYISFSVFDNNNWAHIKPIPLTFKRAISKETADIEKSILKEVNKKTVKLTVI